MPVHVVYEIRDTMRLATSIELLEAAGTAHASTLDTAGRPSESATAYAYWVEAGIFSDSDAADALVARLLQQQESVSLDTVTAQPGRPRLLRVQVGPFPDEASATAAQHRLEAHTRHASLR
jgi:cell division septation protein DedD